ncbi:MAG: RNA pseudouridine synthase [Treponema sp.]|jgi:23S rRNA pseudouridine1911/1915/1917 synthase|nr:RNA pseudouridine synthase [Treponema sp.]
MSGYPCFSLWAAPRVIDETGAYAVVYKPPLMFCAPLSDNPTGTLLGWFAGHCPAVLEASRSREGGLLHRLDFETEGLVLFAKTREAFVSLRDQQAAGSFVKEYSAVTCAVRPAPAGFFSSGPGGPSGFPPLPPPFDRMGLSSLSLPLSVESFFRAWGPGRKAVRPVVREPVRPTTRPLIPGKRRRIAHDKGGPYRTELLAAGEPGCSTPGETGSPRILTLRIHRGFRHQIRCHLAWIGEPILNDFLYGGYPAGYLAPWQGGAAGPDTNMTYPIALRACAFRFFNPSTGKQQDYRLPGFGELPGLTELSGFAQTPGSGEASGFTG